MAYVTICTEEEFPNDGRMKFAHEGLDIVLFKIDDKYYAIDRQCSHSGGDLSTGTLEKDIIICPVHEATFSVKTGKFVDIGYTSPALVRIMHDIMAYNVIVHEGKVMVEV